MCGIAGLLGITQSLENLERLSRRMQIALQHRGPDDQGIYISSNCQVALVHTRLSILDLSSAGHQPMSTADQRYWITFNGEIYNFRQLRAEMELAGEHFYSQTDTEVVLKLYQKWGANCVKKLRGMFAFAIWDDWEKACFIARDPLGIKPLYYWQAGLSFIFASEVRTILASGIPPRQISVEGLQGYLLAGSVPEPHTLIEGIYCLEAGQSLYWQAGTVKKTTYWQLQFPAESIPLPDAIAKVRAAFLDSIQHHFISDVPVGIFLSGGIDSTALVALSRQVQSGSLQTYSIAFEEAQWNEGAIAKKVAGIFATDHTELVITSALARSLLPKFLSAIDQPSVDGFNTFCVSYLAHKQGAKVVLSGLGGDEIFGGYKSFQVIPPMMRWGQVLHKLRCSAAIGMGLQQWSSSIRLRRLGDFLQHPPDAINAYRSFRGIFSQAEVCKILHYYLPAHSPSKHSVTAASVDQFSLLETISVLEISQYMRNQLLRDNDVMSMSWGLELRVPLVDSAFLEAISTIPGHIRLSTGKQLLTQAVPEIPEYVIHRPKQGFAFPFEQWMQTDWQDLFTDLPVLPGISLQPWYRRWSLAVLQHWWRQIVA